MASNREDEGRLSRLILAYDEALRCGESYDGSEEDDLSPALRSELASVKQCLRVLRQPNSKFGADTQTGRDDVTPLPGSPLPRGLSWQPTHIGRFKICRELGAGGGGIVFLADDPQLGRQVALKIPPLEFLSLPQLRLRFARDAKAAALLHHPNIVTVHEVGETGLISYIASEYCEGGSLADWLADRTDPVPIGEAVEIVLAVTQAVQHAHGRGVLHRDIKPGNVLRACSEEATADQRWVPKLGDFGLARILNSEDERTRTGTVLGTSAYMSPEQALGRVNDIDVRSDVYALGALLYELLAGQPPLKGATDAETIHRVVYEEVPSLQRWRRDVPRDLEAICLKCLAKSPESRYATAEALADDLLRLAQGKSTVARPLNAPQRASLWARRRPALASALSLLSLSLILLGVIAGWYQWRLVRALAETETYAQDLEERAYAADLSKAFELWGGADNPQVTPAVTESLASTTPRPGRRDLRTFPWRLLDRQVHGDHHVAWRGAEGLDGLAIAPRRNLLAFGTDSGQVYLGDMSRRAFQPLPYRHVGEINDLAFSPDEELLASVADDHTVRIWSLGQQALVHTIVPESLGNDTVHALQFSPTEPLLASASEDGIVRLFDTRTWHQVDALPQQEYEVTKLSFAGDGRRLLVVGKLDVRVWNFATREWETTIGIHRQGGDTRTAVGGGLFLPDGQHFATMGLKDHTVRVWNQGDGKELATFSGGAGWFQALSASSNGRHVAYAGKDGIIWIGDRSSKQRAAQLLGHEGGVRDLVFGADGRELWSIGDDGTLRAWSMATSLTRAQQVYFDIPAFGLWISPQADHLWVLDHAHTFCQLDLLKPTLGAWRSCDSHYGKFATSGDGQRIAYCDPGELGTWGEVVVEEVETGRSLARVPIDGEAYCLWLSPSGDDLLVGLSHNSFIYDLETGAKRPLRLPPGNLAFAFEGRNDTLLLVLQLMPTGNCVVADYDRDQESVISLMPIEGGGKYPPSVSPERDWLAVPVDKNILVYDLKRRTRVAVLSGHTAAVPHVAFSPTCPTLASSALDGTLRFWDLRGLHAAGQIKLGCRPQSLQFSRDGDQLLVAGDVDGDHDSRGVIQAWSARRSGQDLRLPETIASPYSGRFAMESASGELRMDAQGREGKSHLALLPVASSNATAGMEWTLAPTPRGGFSIRHCETELCLSVIPAPEGQASAALGLQPLREGDPLQRWDIWPAERAPYVHLRNLASQTVALLSGESEIVLVPWASGIGLEGWRLRRVDPDTPDGQSALIDGVKSETPSN